MHIIIRNLITVVRNHTIAQQQPLLPMSNYKWQQVAMLLMALGLPYEEMMPADKRKVSVKARQLLAKAQRNSHPTLDNDSQDVDNVMPNSNDTLRAVMRNRHTNRRLQQLQDDEEKDEDKAPATWEFFNLMVYNAEQLIGGRVHMPALLLMVTTLQQQGHLIDYPKLETWIQQLHLIKPVNWLTTVLVEVWGMEEDEIQYTYNPHPKAADMLYKALHKLLARLEKVARKPRSLGKAILMPLSQTTPKDMKGLCLLPRRKTLRYAPREALPLMLSNFHQHKEAMEE